MVSECPSAERFWTFAVQQLHKRYTIGHHPKTYGLIQKSNHMCSAIEISATDAHGLENTRAALMDISIHAPRGIAVPTVDRPLHYHSCRLLK